MTMKWTEEEVRPCQQQPSEPFALFQQAPASSLAFAVNCTCWRMRRNCLNLPLSAPRAWTDAVFAVRAPTVLRIADVAQAITFAT